MGQWMENYVNIYLVLESKIWTGKLGPCSITGALIGGYNDSNELNKGRSENVLGYSSSGQ